MKKGKILRGPSETVMLFILSINNNYLTFVVSDLEEENFNCERQGERAWLEITHS